MGPILGHLTEPSNIAAPWQLSAAFEQQWVARMPAIISGLLHFFHCLHVQEKYVSILFGIY